MHRSNKPSYSITSSAPPISDGGTSARRLGGFEIDHRLVLGWRLHRKVRRLLAPEDAVYVAGSAPVRINSFRLSMP